MACIVNHLIMSALQNKLPNRLRYCAMSVLLFLFFVCCEVPFEHNASRDFIIRGGEHFATPRLYETFEEDKLAFRATFDESAQYALDDPALQTSKNKLMGFSDCHSAHHANSARFAWQWYNDRLEIFAYCYVDSARVEAFVGTVELNKENLYEITKTGTEYVFFLNGERKAGIPRNSSCEEGLNYMLYPYFGGSLPAPHDVRVQIEML